MWVGIGIGINRNRYAKGIFNAYSARVVADGGVTEAGQCVDAGATPLLQTASLLLIPSGYKGGKLYSEIPTSGAGDSTWTRASDGTRTNASGVIQRVPWNLWQRSEEFMNVAWIKSNTSITANTTTSPNGTLTADTLSIGVDASAVRHRLSQSITATIGTTYTGTYYLKANQHQWIQIVAVSGFSTGVWANFDLVNGTIGNTGGVDTTASIENVGNGWYRCRVGGVATATSTTGFEILTTNNTNSGRYPSYQSLVAEDVCYVWGAQVVEGSSAETYLPTTDRLGFPRLDYTFGSCPALLLETQRTNLALWSEQFNDATWTKTNASITANSVTSPDGTTNADTFESTTNSNANVTINQSITIVSGTTYSTSIYVKANTQRFIFINFASSGSIQDFVTAIFDLNDFTLGQTAVGTTSGTLVSTSIQQASNGFYRITIVASINRTDGRFRIGFAGAKTGNFIGSTGECAVSNTLGQSIYLWGAQLEAGNFPSTLIPTTTASATRVPDQCTISGASSLIGQSEGTLFFEIYFTNISNAQFRIFGSLEGSVANQFSGVIIGTTNNGNDITYAGASYYLSTGRHKIACTYSQTNNQRKLFVDGVLRATGTHTTFLATIDRLSLGCRLNPFTSFSTDRPLASGSGIFDFALFNSLLTDAQCVALTSL